MESLIKFIGGMTLFVGGMFALLILGTLFGAICGWAVGLFFGPTILYTLHHWTGLPADTSMWSLGATLGFVGGFFKSISSSTTSK